MATSFPALAINTQGESPLNELARIEQIKGAQQQQQLQGQQLQSGALALQQQRTNVQSQQTLMQLFSKNNGDFNQTYADAKASGQVTPNDLFNFQTNAVDLQTKAAKLTTDQLTNAAAEQKFMSSGLEEFRALAPGQRTPDALARIVGNIATQGVDVSKFQGQLQQLAQNPTDDAIKLAETGLMGREWVINNEMKEREMASAPTVSQAQAKNEAEAQRAVTEAQVANQTLLNMPSAAEAKTERMAALRETVAKTNEANASAAQKTAETSVMQANPVFAMNPQTKQRVLTTMSAAKGQGLTNIMAANTEQVGKEAEVNRQLNVMQQGISNYGVSLQRLNLEQPSDAQDKIMAQLLSGKGNYGAITEKVTELIGEGRQSDAATELAKAQDFNQLTPARQQAVVDYFSARTAVPLVQKALTGVGRMNEAVMDIDMRMIPTPMEGPSAQAKLGRFQSTIDATAQGQVDIPWITRTSDIRQSIENRGRQVYDYNLKHPTPPLSIQSGPQ